MADPTCPILSSPVPRAAVPAPLTHHVSPGPRPRDTQGHVPGCGGHTFLLLEQLPGAAAGGTSRSAPSPSLPPSPALCASCSGATEGVRAPGAPRCLPRCPPGWLWGTERQEQPGLGSFELPRDPRSWDEPLGRHRAAGIAPSLRRCLLGRAEQELCCPSPPGHLPAPNRGSSERAATRQPGCCTTFPAAPSCSGGPSPKTDSGGAAWTGPGLGSSPGGQGGVPLPQTARTELPEPPPEPTELPGGATGSGGSP
ncbi:translation initiation factor IF-2-like [Parus major]|uniref:translation initiation factor IF-2-like n=1 Tax=Parus major TaxID=9157 RepID=UPI00144446D4|nr:translation initiation factor IF-2-like [Parus major]